MVFANSLFYMCGQVNNFFCQSVCPCVCLSVYSYVRPPFCLCVCRLTIVVNVFLLVPAANLPHGQNKVCYTDEKGNKIFLIYKEILMGPIAKSYMRKGFLVYMRKAQILNHIRGGHKSYIIFFMKE